MTTRPHCQHPGACRSKGGGHCRTCWGAHTGRRMMAAYAAKSVETRRARKVHVTLAPLRSQSQEAAE
jgi:hypothetical protein